MAVSKTKVQVLVVNSCSVILFSFNTCNLALHIFARRAVIEVQISVSNRLKDLNCTLQVSCQRWPSFRRNSVIPKGRLVYWSRQIYVKMNLYVRTENLLRIVQFINKQRWPKTFVLARMWNICFIKEDYLASKGALARFYLESMTI